MTDTYPTPTRTLRTKLAPEPLEVRIMHGKLDATYFERFIRQSKGATRYQLVQMILIHKHALVACEEVITRLALAHGTNTRMRAALLELSRIIESLPSDIHDKALTEARDA